MFYFCLPVFQFGLFQKVIIRFENFVLGCYGYQKRLPVITQIPKIIKKTYTSSSRLVIKFSSVLFLPESRTLESSISSTLREKKQYEIFFTMLHSLEIFNFEEKVFSNFSCMFLNPNNFFQFEF